MSDHTRALVPLETGPHSAPDLLENNRLVDIGLLAEALVYYDRVLINVSNPTQFADLISWLIQQGLTYQQLIELFRDGIFYIYDYAFHSTPIMDNNNNVIDVINIQDPIMEKPNSFGERYLNSYWLRKCFSSYQEVDEFSKALDGRIIEVKASEFGALVDNAKSDFLETRRCELILQELIDELYRVKSLGRPPVIQAFVTTHAHDSNLTEITWNIDFQDLAKIFGNKLSFGPTLPLSMSIMSNKYIWSASQQGCDLYLSSPISAVVGDKLYEADHAFTKTQHVIDQLEAEVEFPDLRYLVNTGQIDFKDVLNIRTKAKRFRQWLQTESDRDRNAIIAYHNEVSRDCGLIKFGRKSLKLFGVISGGAVGAALGAKVNNPSLGAATGAAIGGAIGTATRESFKYIFDVGSKIGSEWKPVAFGNWYQARIAKLLK